MDVKTGGDEEKAGNHMLQLEPHEKDWNLLDFISNLRDNGAM